MTDGSLYLRVVWFGLPKSVNSLRKALLFSLLQIGKLRLREVRYLAQDQPASKLVMKKPRQIDLGIQLLSRGRDKPFAILETRLI